MDLISQFHTYERMSRCGQCYWALYDGDWCQNPKCKNSGLSVLGDRIYLTNDEARILIDNPGERALTPKHENFKSKE